MDAIKLLKEINGICEYYLNCNDGCPLRVWCDEGIYSLSENPEKVIKTVEQWATEHLKKTRQSEFLKVLPRAKVEDGILCYYPCDMDAREGFKEENCKRFQGSCYMCRREYWMTEVE